MLKMPTNCRKGRAPMDGSRALQRPEVTRTQCGCNNLYLGRAGWGWRGLSGGVRTPNAGHVLCMSSSRTAGLQLQHRTNLHLSYNYTGPLHDDAEAL